MAVKINNLNARYLFTSDHLGFRAWSLSDLEELYALNTDPDVMAYFPKLYTRDECTTFIKKMQDQYEQRGYCYYVVEDIDNKSFIGFIGISYQDYASPFTPCIDIGWRLKRAEWHKGLATEGARAALDHAFNNLHIKTIYSVAPCINTPSIAVMKKLGMSRQLTFDHPYLIDHPELMSCEVYRIDNINP